MRWWWIRRATPEDVDACQAVARKFRDELGFVRRPALREAAARRELHVAEMPDGSLGGFVNWHARRDGWHTVYELAVREDLHGQGLGRALLYSVPTPTRLKCTTDNERANRFYQRAGMTLACVEDGRKRTLNVWERRVLTMWVQGRNEAIPAITRAAGMAYGVRSDYQSNAWPYIMDIHWRDYDWRDVLEKVRDFRPVMALAPDYEHASQRPTLHRQIADLRAAGVLRVAVCPKFEGATLQLPQWCIVAVSIPTDYAGFLPPFAQLAGRRVHLLGGSPQRQNDYAAKMRGHGAHVLSVDGNSHNKAARTGTWYDVDHARWRTGEPYPDYADILRHSAENITDAMERAATVAQLPLF